MMKTIEVKSQQKMFEEWQELMFGKVITTTMELDDYYLDKGKWTHYKSIDSLNGYKERLIPVHNGFGSHTFKGKKVFVLWMHY